MSKWVDAYKSVPEMGNYVLTVDSDREYNVARLSDTNSWIDRYGHKIYNVVCWRKLPEIQLPPYDNIKGTDIFSEAELFENIWWYTCGGRQYNEYMAKRVCAEKGLTHDETYSLLRFLRQISTV